MTLCFGKILLFRLPIGHGGVINSPRLVFLGFFSGVTSRATAHRLYHCTYCCLSQCHQLSRKLCHHNTQFKMYTITSKKQEGSTCKDSYRKCFIMTNFNKLHRERAMNCSHCED